MKKIFTLLASLFIASFCAFAQPGFEGGFGGGPRGGHGPFYDGPGSMSYGFDSFDRQRPRGRDEGRGGFDPRGRGDGRGYGMGFDRGSWYGGLMFGLSTSHVSSESDELDGNRIKSGISLGAALGFELVPMTFFETGLYYVEKGGSSKNSLGRFSYGLNYLEVPLVLKYIHYTDRGFTIQPYVGGYLGLGISGEIKDYNEREAFSSYSSDYFRRGDSGLRFGCGASWSFLYLGVSYDLGLANIGRDTFADTRNRAFIFNVGFAF